jgi:GntR family transcriptional regulator
MLADLEREGYVERGRGVGTVINRDIVNLNNRLDLKVEYNDLIRGTGAVPSTDSVRLYQQVADEAAAECLSLDVGAPLIVCEKRILASGTPVIYSIDYLPKALFSDVDWQALDWSVPVFDLLEEYFGILVDTNITRVAAVIGSPAIREKLRPADGEALILLNEVGYYKLSRPIIHSHGFYTNYFEFSLLRKKF